MSLKVVKALTLCAGLSIASFSFAEKECDSVTTPPKDGTSNVSKPEIIYSETYKWCPLIPGLSDTWVFGANETKGLYIFRVKLAPGAIMPAHTHPDERTTSTLEGTIYVGIGPKFDPATVKPVPKGSVYVVPANVPHFIWAKDGAAEYQEEGAGPTNTTMVHNHSASENTASSTSSSN